MYPTEEAIGLMRNAHRIAALSGAGISTEAGVPDFRGPAGLWQDPERVRKLSATGFREDPESFYSSSMNLFSTMAKAAPTMAHRLLVRLQDIGKLDAVVTQNIDGLHQKAGSSKVFEVHGTFRTGYCPKCGAEFEMEPFYRDIENGKIKVPLCKPCKVPIKPDIVLFEELLPQDAWNGAVETMEACDLLLVLGSSLMVYPAAELPSIALVNGAKLIIVNLEATAYDGAAAVVVRDKLGSFAASALAAFIQ
ncbi:MAG: Sir2 family NAD-dependent protein deacetylase [Acidobacteria bacterium]|nr:Sir2 family NAD-dependent protein deacetylase [Acidobacteriota bacterium]